MKPRLLLCAFFAAGSLFTAASPDDKPVSETPSRPGAQPAVAGKSEFPPIREFDLETIVKLGREIYRHDQLAWVATDALFAQIQPRKYQADGGCGWVVDTSGPEPVVRFLRKQRLLIVEEAAYDITFPKDAKPVVSVPTDRSLTAHQVAARAALDTALAPFKKSQYPLCRVSRGNYNYVVLDDPSGPGFLVYLLRPKDTNDSIPIGGHYRISVSADGKTLKQVDRLSASCLAIDKREGSAKGTVDSVISTHIVSDTPVETHVFLSLQDKLPLYIGTASGRMWKIDAGTITPFEIPEPAPTAPPTPTPAAKK